MLPSLISVVVVACLSLLPDVIGQGMGGFNPFSLLMAGDNNNGGAGGLSGGFAKMQNMMKLQALERRLQALETNVRSGAYGGCESGILGPLSPSQNRGVIRFQGYFMSPPTLQLSTSDITTAFADQIVSFKIRPYKISSTEAIVGLEVPANGGNIKSLYVSYSACPSNINVAIPTTPAVTSPAARLHNNFGFNSNNMWSNPMFLAQMMGGFGA